MYGMQSLFLTLMLALLGKVYSQSRLSGKCRTDGMKPIVLDGEMVPGKWDIPYFSNLDDDSELDHAFFTIRSTGDNAYRLVTTKVLKNGRPFVRYYKLSFNDNIIISQITYHGKVSEYKMYPLAKSSEDAILFYHCSDTGIFPMDVRFIAIPDGRTLSDVSFKQFLDVDKGYNFTGNLYKLPKNLKK